jgi:AcrR family transcriptional regulator
VRGVTATNLNEPTGTEGSRAAALTRRIAELDPGGSPEESRLDALGLGLVDALLSADDAALNAALRSLREARAQVVAADAPNERLLGWLTAAIAFAYWGLERLPATGPGEIAEGTHAWEFIRALERSAPLGSGELRDLLDVDVTEVSRSGRRLVEGGLVRRTKVGRRVFWELTPRGRRALELAQSPSRARASDGGGAKAEKGVVGADFWMAAIRQGFEGAAGDEPGMGRRTVDPTRERIVETTLALHQEHGILETTEEQIAERAGVPLETLENYFPTRDDLIKSCGRHVLSSLRLPPPDRAAEIFAGASSEEERMHRLTETLFDVYERQSHSIERGRQDRSKIPIVDEAFGQVETAVDALVAEALRPLDPNAETIASVRALTDLEVWRALREAGASPGDSVDDASAALERWLEARRGRLGSTAA